MISLRGFKKAKRAFTFVEVLLAIFIIGVGVLPVLTLFLTGTRTIESGGLIFQVAVAAQNIMDTVRSDTFLWQGLPVDIKIPSDEDRGLYLPTELVKKYKAQAFLKIDVAKGHTILNTGEPEENLYQIDILVTWEENGIKKQYSLTNYRANINWQTMKTSTRFE
ncbi:MAG: prepilin-type N-terminal cleavage/methylation domain-containing protein [Candidatus Riflebacteria bacterium]|nr:prepilin-type N-terminal cleavage/methylation domain-containing protein [Candidatus Riflebacteria bacterium]